MYNILDLIRHYDFRIYYHLYQIGLDSSRAAYFYYFFARYGIVFFFLSFIYLILKKKISAFLCTLLAMGIAGGVDFAVYVFWQRPRPFITHPNIMMLNVFGVSTNSASFPSSHTYIAFAIATSLFLYGHRRLGSFLFALAICVAIGRIGSGLHYPSDVIGGALLGIVSGFLVFLLFRGWEKSRTYE